MDGKDTGKKRGTLKKKPAVGCPQQTDVARQGGLSWLQDPGLMGGWTTARPTHH